MRARAFLEIASSLAWTRFEDDHELRYPDGRKQQNLSSSDHWLAGVELGAGFHYTVTGALGAEWGLRYAYRGAPSKTEANRRSDVERDGISSLSLVAGLTPAGRHDHALLGLFLGRVRDDDPAGGRVFLVDPLDQDAVLKWSDFHLSSLPLLG